MTKISNSRPRIKTPETGRDTARDARGAHETARDTARNSRNRAQAPDTSQGNPDLSELVFILDRSGSMTGMEDDTIGGFNSVLEKHKEIPGQAYVSTILFDHETFVLHDHVPIGDIKPLTADDYVVRGSTALLDAVYGCIRHIDRMQHYMPRGSAAGHVIFVIVTDGYENSSCRASYKDVKEAIEAHEDLGWEFIFLGANIDAIAEAGRIGIRAARASSYICDDVGSDKLYRAVGEFTCLERMAMPDSAPQGSEWKKLVEDDHKKRSKH